MDNTFCVIDDELEVCDLLRLYFESRGYRCAVAHDGQAGLEMVRKIKPLAVLLDVQLPRRNGAEVLAELRRDPAFSKTPVLLMTGLLGKTSLSPDEWAKSIGADAVILKPFEFDALFAILSRMIPINA